MRARPGAVQARSSGHEARPAGSLQLLLLKGLHPARAQKVPLSCGRALAKRLKYLNWMMTSWYCAALLTSHAQPWTMCYSLLTLVHPQIFY